MPIIRAHLIDDGAILENDLKSVLRLPITIALQRDVYAIVAVGPTADNGFVAKPNECPYLGGRTDRWEIIFWCNVCFDIQIILEDVQFCRGYNSIGRFQKVDNCLVKVFNRRIVVVLVNEYLASFTIQNRQRDGLTNVAALAFIKSAFAKPWKLHFAILKAALIDENHASRKSPDA
jgi:hypothetical protein